MSRFFITGASGFLGTHLVRQLRQANHQLAVLCRKPEPALEAAGISVHLGDVTDAASVRKAATGCVGAFHCAGKVSRDPADAAEMYRVHVDGTKTTLAALREVGVGRVVVASTSGVVAVTDDADEVRDEEAATPLSLIARWPYYRSKLFAEQAALAEGGHGLEVVCLNPSLLLGPGDERGSSTEDVRLFLERKVPFCPGGGIAFVDVRDAAAAFLMAFERGKPGRRYLINAANMTIATFFGRLARISGVKAPPLRLPSASAALVGAGVEWLGRAAKLLHVPVPLDRISAEMSQYYWYCDSARAQLELGWSFRDAGETLLDTIDDLRARGVVWPAG
ncbi:MAG TPA: NAD-dependent epimerase/dehydratase family protein [Sorangium sp.]|nr:NAD-dependent epimerase/dehydratase family protein [Sorangium sp.]